MRVVKPQPLLANFSPTQWGRQAQMCIAIGVGFRLSDPRVLAHEASVWEALRATPTVAPLSETGMPKQCAEWLLAGHTQCAFSNTALGLVRDWTAQVGLGNTVKKISAQTTVVQGVHGHGHALGCLSVDHTQSIQGANAANPAGHAGASAPLQILTWHGPQSAALAGMAPLDARWPERRQWLPQFASTLQAMALDGSHMGWPKGTDTRYFQQAAPDQWSAEAVWPAGAAYALRGFGVAGCGYAGNLPRLVPEVVVCRGAAHEAVALRQQTVWFLPDQDLGVIWWSGAVNLAHPLDDSLSMLVVALREIGNEHRQGAGAGAGAGHAPAAAELVAYATRRTNAKAPDLAAQSDLPLLPALSAGWAWEQILNAEQHPRDRRVSLGYAQLRAHILEEEKRMAHAHSQMQQLLHAPALPKPWALPAAPSDAHDLFAWKTPLEEARGQKLHDVTFTQQNFQDSVWTGWTLVNVRFVSCVMDRTHWTDCVFENVEFTDTSFDQAQWHNTTWAQGAMQRCKANRATWHNTALTHVRLAQCEFSAHAVAGGTWHQVMVDEVQWLSSSWCELATQGLALVKSQLPGLQVRACTLDKLSVIETHASRSQWVQSRFVNAAFVESTDLRASFWQDCDCTNTCWIGLLAQEARIAHCSFTNLNAQGAHLGQSVWAFCSLNGAQFLNADLRGACFERTSLRGAVLSGAQLQGSQITHCNLIRTNTSNAIHPAPGLWRNNLEGGSVMQPQRHP